MKALEWIERNLMALIAAALALYGGYLIGQERVTAKLEQIDLRLHAIEGALKDQRKFSECATRRLDQLANAVKAPPPCVL